MGRSYIKPEIIQSLSEEAWALHKISLPCDAAPNPVLARRQAILRKSPDPRILVIQGIKCHDKLAAPALDSHQHAAKQSLAFYEFLDGFFEIKLTLA